MSALIPVFILEVDTPSLIFEGFPHPRGLRRDGVFGFVCKWPPPFNYSGGWKRDSLHTPTRHCPSHRPQPGQCSQAFFDFQ